MSKEFVCIAQGNDSFSLLPRVGGMGVSLILKGRELLYLPENFWTEPNKAFLGGLPYCFPVCGRLIKGEMPLHGFAPYLPWLVTHLTASSVTIELNATPDTLRSFPYLFRVSLEYSIDERGLRCQQRIENLGDAPMPMYAGFHPYFLVPLTEKTNTSIFFESTKRLQYNSTLTNVIGELPALVLPKPVTDPEVNEQLSVVKAHNQAQLRFSDGSVIELAITGKEYPFIQLYTEADKPFFCIEPWMNHPGAYYSVEKLHYILPGKTQENRLSIRLRSSSD